MGYVVHPNIRDRYVTTNALWMSAVYPGQSMLGIMNEI